jgi:hypothetical protein
MRVEMDLGFIRRLPKLGKECVINEMVILDEFLGHHCQLILN